MKKLILLICCLVSVVSIAQKKEKIKGSRNVVEISKEFPASFNTVEIDDGLEVDLRVSSLNSYKLEADDNLFEVIKLTVTDSVLKIYTTHKITSSKKIKLELTTDGLERIVLRNDASLDSKGQLTSNQLSLVAYNSSRFDLDVEATVVEVELHQNAGGELELKSDETTIKMYNRTDLEAEISTNNLTVNLEKDAELKLKGDAADAEYELKDATRLRAKNLKATNANLYIERSSEIELTTSRNLELYAKDKSRIYLYGNPKIKIKGLSDTTKLIKKD